MTTKSVVQVIRESRGLNQVEFADLIGVKQACVFQIEAGKRGLSMPTGQLISQKFNIPFTILMESQHISERSFLLKMVDHELQAYTTDQLSALLGLLAAFKVKQ